MGYSMRLFATFFLVAMLLLSTEMGPIRSAKARTCESQSHSFKGTCISDTNCASICQTEGFMDGNCNGLRRRCFCTADC